MQPLPAQVAVHVKQIYKETMQVQFSLKRAFDRPNSDIFNQFLPKFSREAHAPTLASLPNLMALALRRLSTVHWVDRIVLQHTMLRGQETPVEEGISLSDAPGQKDRLRPEVSDLRDFLAAAVPCMRGLSRCKQAQRCVYAAAVGESCSRQAQGLASLVGLLQLRLFLFGDSHGERF